MSLMVVNPASLPSAALLGVGLFASKNVDDIFLTMAFLPTPAFVDPLLLLANLLASVH
jgi:hypothetical protein